MRAPLRLSSANSSAAAAARHSAIRQSIAASPATTASGVTTAPISGPSRCAGMPIACITGPRSRPSGSLSRTVCGAAMRGRWRTRRSTSPSASAPPAR
ncbi:hypothetical protein BURPSS13_C0086 [Burkholderia pseudomallei S13]|nr:hypothetical protein BURPSS13_C0086 [Burkholderia pseudomallei S13]